MRSLDYIVDVQGEGPAYRTMGYIWVAVFGTVSMVSGRDLSFGYLDPQR